MNCSSEILDFKIMLSKIHYKSNGRSVKCDSSLSTSRRPEQHGVQPSQIYDMEQTKSTQFNFCDTWCSFVYLHSEKNS